MESVSAETIGLPFVRSVIGITRICTPTKPGEKATTGTRYYVSSLEISPGGGKPTMRAAKIFGGLSRGHWSIENKNHWKKDSEWGDDKPRQKQTGVARTLSLLKGALLAHVREPLPDLFARCQKSASAAFNIVKSALRPLK